MMQLSWSSLKSIMHEQRYWSASRYMCSYVQHFSFRHDRDDDGLIASIAEAMDKPLRSVCLMSGAGPVN